MKYNNKQLLEKFEAIAEKRSLDLTKSKHPEPGNPYYETLTFVAYAFFKAGIELD